MSTPFLLQDEEFLGWWPFLCEFLLALGSEVMEELHYVEQFFINMRNLYSFVSQVCFFILIDSILENNGDLNNGKGDRSVLVALTTILFYSVFTYFVSKVKDIMTRQRFQLVGSFLTSEHLCQWICKIILEWIKAVVIVVCLREQGIQYQPSLIYSMVTFFYYLCTEKLFVDTFPELLELAKVESLENLEHLYVPMVLNSIAITAGAVGTFLVVFRRCSSFVVLSFYFLVYIRTKDIYHNNYKVLIIERETFRSFKVATREQIIAWNDICAVCLNTMSRARITPCNHLFHPHCLKQCLKNSLLCPLCKTHFLEHNTEIKL